MLQYFRVTGTGHYLPSRVVTCDEADRRAGKSPGWTMRHTRVQRRRECTPPESPSSMACSAIRQAVRDSGCSWNSIDLLIDCSTSRQQPIPCNAALVQRDLQELPERVPGFDVQSTCLGFILALQVANGLFAAGGYQRVVVVASESALAGVNWEHSESACLISDGAAAVVLERADAPLHGYHFVHETYAQHVEACQVRGGGHLLPPFHYSHENDSEYRFRMDGPELFRIAARHLPPMVQQLVSNDDVPAERLHVIPHQASPRAVSRVGRLLKIPRERYHNRAAELGNMAAASIPTVLDTCRREQRLPDNTPLMLLGTSAGYSQAAMILTI